MGKVLVGVNVITFDDKYSFKDYTGQKVSIPSNTVVYASCFSQEIVDRKIFDDLMTGVKFYNCNLDNCVIPPGNTAIGGSQRRFQVQNDRNDWLIDVNNKPTMPTNQNIFIKLNLPMPKPEDIPAQMVSEVIDLLKLAQTQSQLKITPTTTTKKVKA